MTSTLDTAYCFDLDGTVTRQEILPAIASEIGLSEELALLTSLTMRGLVPFESSFRLRCRLLRDIPVSRAREIVSGVPLDPVIIGFIRERSELCAIVTGNLDVWVGGLLEQIGGLAFTSNGVVNDDRLDDISLILRKNDPVEELRQRGFARVVAIGDGYNDIPMLQAADIGVAFGGVHQPVPELIEEADFAVYSGECLCRLLRVL